MESRNIHEHAEWFASYMNAQGEALVLCQAKKIRQLTELLEVIKGEIELKDEVSSEIIFNSIETLIDEIEEVEHTSGYFKWVG